MAEISRWRTHRVNMGNFEWAEFGASVKFSAEEIAESSEEVLFEAADALLDEALAPELRLAAELTAEEDSFVLHHPVNKTPVKKGKN